MNSKFIFSLAIFALGWWGPAVAGELVLAPESTLFLEGNSTLHAYHSTATVLNVNAEMESAAPGTVLEKLEQGGLQKLTVTIPVQSMKSGKAGLDKKLSETLKAKEHPAIFFELQNYQTTKLADSPKEKVLLHAKGLLEVAGVTKPIELEVQTETDSDGLQFSGKKELFMTDFGIKPPKMMMGALKTDNRVVIHFHLILK